MPRSPRSRHFVEFEPSRPIEARGGIKARSKRGSFASKWWGKRWIEVLETLNLGGRLQRARSYARRGQVLELTVEAGRVRAKVQGSRPKPYAIDIKATQLSVEAAQRLREELAGQPYFLAKLTIGEMPDEIEALFVAAKVSLFPARASELQTDCSCPDWSNPCKHIAAVYYLLGEEFDRDPFIIFKFRGLDAETLLQDVGTPCESPAVECQADDPAETPLKRGAPPPADFWEGTRPEVDFVAPPSAQAAPLLRRLGNLPFWRGSEPLVEALEPLYRGGVDDASALSAGSWRRGRVDPDSTYPTRVADERRSPTRPLRRRAGRKAH